MELSLSVQPYCLKPVFSLSETELFAQAVGGAQRQMSQTKA